MTLLIRGGNMSVVRPHGEPVGAVLIGISWERRDADVNLFVILCGADRRVRGDGDFLFWDQPVAKGDTVFLLDANMGRGPGPDGAQVVADLAALPADVDRFVIALATVEDGTTLRSLGGLRGRVVDAHTGLLVAEYHNDAGYTEESCCVIWELYRRGGEWKVRAVDQGWDGGVSDLARAYGVDVAS